MSTESERDHNVAGFPELTGLGTRIEMLRIGRGLSKQLLARRAGTSRQQLWRVMTGKSDLTGSLRQRLAEVLAVDHRVLDQGDRLLKPSGSLTAFASVMAAPTELAVPVLPDHTRVAASRAAAPEAGIDQYVCDCEAIARTLATIPEGSEGRRLKKHLLNALEEIAAERGVRLGAPFFDLRARVINDEA